MSKYVRTENEIIYVGDLIKDEYGNYCDPKNYETDMEVSNEYIIKESDDLKELCDCFVYMDTKHNIIQYKYMIRNSLCSNDMKYMKMGTEIYGAIWTDKGLIYVAKMNEEGDLKLL